MINTAYILLGSNLGNKEQNLNNAKDLLKKYVGDIEKYSTYFYSEPWGFESINKFINQAIEIKTQLSPLDLLKQTQFIEKKIGRKTKTNNNVYSDRIIDIDILFYNNIIYKSNELIIPHPLLHKRLFVLEPLNEIANNLTHPILNKNINSLLNDIDKKYSVNQ